MGYNKRTSSTNKREGRIMRIADGLIMELQAERASAREILNRIPEDQWDYTPHEKSMPIGRLGSHIAETYDWIDSIVDLDVFEFDMESYKPQTAATKEELLASFDTGFDALIAKLDEQSDEHLMGIWQMKMGGQVVMEFPRVAVIRNFMISHTIHHRAQLTVYLRLLNVPLPSIYGPSADEDPM